MAAMFVNGSGQNVQSLERTFYRCFLQSFSSFGGGFSEEKIKMWKVNRRRTPSDGKSSHCLWQGDLKMKANKHKHYTLEDTFKQVIKFFKKWNWKSLEKWM